MTYPIYYVEEDDTLPIFFDTFDGGTGASITMTGLAVTDIEIYKDGSATQRASDSGFTLLDTDGIDFDGITGIHGFSIDLSDNSDSGFYAVGSWYHVVVSSVTIDGQTVSFVAAAFRIVSATRGMAGTALPDAAADAAGGLPISDAGGLDLDTILGRITGNVALASVVGALTDAAADGDPTTADTLMQYVKQLINVLVGTAGIVTFPAEAAPANAVSLAEVIRAIHADVTGLNGDAMRGTDNALLAASAPANFGDLAITATTGRTTVGSVATGAIGRAAFAADTGLQTIRSNTAQAGAAGSITLDTGASSVTDFYAGKIIYLTGGTGAGQSRICIGYNGTTKVASITPSWSTNPDATTTFAVLAIGDINVASWRRSQPNALVSSRVDASVGAMAANVLTATAIAPDAIGASELAADAVAEIQSGLATSANQTTILNRIGAFTGSGVNTILGFFQAVLRSDASNPSDLGGTYDAAADSQEAIRDRGDAAWTTGGGGGITDILNLQPVIPNSIDLADTATVRLGLMLTNALDDLPSTAEITPGTISIERKAIGGTSWSAVVTDAACSEQAGLIYYDEVFDSGSGYAEGDSIRVTFKSQKITVAANDYEITDTNGVMFQTYIRETMRGTDGANTQTPLDAAGVRSAVGLAAADLDTQLDAIPTAAENRAEMDANSTQLAAIVGDTNELQTDWADGGRLDNILDARASQTTADAIETDTQDIQTRLPATLVGGRMDSDIQAVMSDTDVAEVLLRMFEGAHYGTARSSTTSTTIQLALNGDSTSEYYTGRLIVIASGTGAGQARLISAYTGGVSRIATITPAWAITPNTSSEYVILPAGASIWNADWDAEVQSEAADALTAYDPPTYDELLAFVQLLARSDAAINTDRATELSAINTDEGSGAGDYDNTADAQEAIRDRGDLAWVGAGGGLTQQDIRNAMQLTPTDTTQPDSIDDKLDGLEADIAALSGTELTIVNVVRGNTITQHIADTWEFTLSGLGDISDYNVVAFVVKHSEQQDDDNESLLYVRSDDGLVRIGGVAPGDSGNGTLTIGSGEISLLVAMSETAGLTADSARDYRWWIKGYDTDTTPDKAATLATGAFKLKKAGLLSITP